MNKARHRGSWFDLAYYIYIYMYAGKLTWNTNVIGDQVHSNYIYSNYTYIYIYIYIYRKHLALRKILNLAKSQKKRRTTFIFWNLFSPQDNFKEKSPRSGGHTSSLNGFEVTHVFSELSPGLNRVNTTAWIMIFTNIHVMIFFEILFAWDHISRFHMMAISFWCPSMERLEGLKCQLLWSV